MLIVMLQMALLIAAGIVWQRIAPSHISALSHRRALTDIVFNLLLPALVLNVMWKAPLTLDSVKISLTAFAMLFTSLSCIWLVTAFLKVSRPQRGALLLAATFPNATYLGLPVSEALFGKWTQAVVLKFDLFACTPMVLTLGILIGQHFGNHGIVSHPLKELSKVPPLWALIMACVFNLSHIPQPDILQHALQTLSGGVVPLMLIALGMSIRWDTLRMQYAPLLLAVCVITLGLAPFVALQTAHALDLPSHITIAVTLLAAMPTMVFGVIICERYHLDGAIYAAAVFVSTVLSLGTLSLWHLILTR